jgi:antitoxin component YwqK of YwqJK toxin-antitoxin module
VSFASTCTSAISLVLVLAAFSSCGTRSQYYKNGVKRCEGNASWSGKPDGVWTYWYPNGERAESGTYRDGLRVDTWTTWYPNGQKRAEGARAPDATEESSPREGLWTEWYENGERAARGVYRAGKRAGHWDVSHDDGGLDGDRTGEYHDDARID